MPARSTAEICTKTSLEPSVGWMKPKPLVGLNHFTVPLGMIRLLNSEATRKTTHLFEHNERPTLGRTG